MDIFPNHPGTFGFFHSYPTWSYKVVKFEALSIEWFKMKITNVVDLFTILPEHEKIIVDVLRQIVRDALPAYCKEKISYNVPFFYGNKGICIIWPSTVPGGGIKKGVLFGLWYGNKLIDADGFLTRGTNKQVFYKIYRSPDEVDERPIRKLLKQAVELDRRSGIRLATKNIINP
jgi:hypothetical protein